MSTPVQARHSFGSMRISDPFDSPIASTSRARVLAATATPKPSRAPMRRRSSPVPRTRDIFESEFSDSSAPATPRNTSDPGVPQTASRLRTSGPQGFKTPEPAVPTSEMTAEEMDAEAERMALAFIAAETGQKTPDGTPSRTVLRAPKRRHTLAGNRIRGRKSGDKIPPPTNLSTTGLELCSSYEPKNMGSYLSQVFHRNREVIGSGDFGTVLKALRVQTDTYSAIKVLPIQKDNSQHRREIFMLEHLRHPNIIRFEAAWEQMDEVFIQTELCEESLFHLMKRTEGPMPQELALNALVDALRALDYCHHHHVLHLDVKPHNMLICSMGIIKLADFGVAFNFHRDDPTTNEIEGDGRYLAPEVFEDRIECGLPVATTPKRDVYSLGASIFQFATKCELSTGMVRQKEFADSIDDCPAALLPILLQMMENNVSIRPSIADIFSIGLIAEWESKRRMEIRSLGMEIPSNQEAPIADVEWLRLLGHNEGGHCLNNTIA